MISIASINDLPKIKKLCDSCFESEGRHDMTVWVEILKFGKIYVYTIDSDIVGLLVVATCDNISSSTIELYFRKHTSLRKNFINICIFCVEKEHRKKHIGTNLLNFVINNNPYPKCDHYLLSMRKNNSVAMSLYKKHKFIETSILEKDMYDNPKDDELLLIKQIKKYNYWVDILYGWFIK